MKEIVDLYFTGDYIKMAQAINEFDPKEFVVLIKHYAINEWSKTDLLVHYILNKDINWLVLLLA